MRNAKSLKLFLDRKFDTLFLLCKQGLLDVALQLFQALANAAASGPSEFASSGRVSGLNHVLLLFLVHQFHVGPKLVHKPVSLSQRTSSPLLLAPDVGTLCERKVTGHRSLPVLIVRVVFKVAAACVPVHARQFLALAIS